MKLLVTFVILGMLVACDSPAPEPETAPPQRVLRVCADPNNLPFTNERLEGFENRIADLIARDIGARVEYTWWAQRRGFFRNTIRARRAASSATSSSFSTYRTRRARSVGVMPSRSSSLPK